MAESVKNALSGAKEGWNKLDSKRKKILIFGIIAIVVAGTAFGILSSRVNYSVLFTNLDIADAGPIVTDLESKKISYRLDSNGRTILIDNKKLDSYRMELAMNNMLPDSSTGFEIFDDTGLMVTDEDRQIMYQRALTGELQRTIVSLDGINSAKVHLVLPQKSIFDTVAREASASVVIDIRPGFSLSQNAIRGIASLVSGAVDNMPIENVQIIDSGGNLLSGILLAEGAGTEAGQISTYSSARSSFEKELENKLMTLLGSAYGYDAIKVSVMAQLDFNSEESVIVSYYDPVIRSEEVSAAGSNINIQQVTGGNIDDNVSNVIDGDTGTSSSYTKVTNNELSSETRSIIKAPGRIEKLTASIVFNGVLLEQDRTNIQSLVAGIIGYDGDRGDLISVVGISSPKPGEQNVIPGDYPEGTENTFFEQYKLPIMIAGGVLGLIILILIVVLSIGRRKTAKEDKEFKKKLEEGTKIEEIIEEIVVRPDQKGAKAQKYAQEHPELAAELIKSWIRE